MVRNGDLCMSAANPRTNIMDFGGFDSTIILISRAVILRLIGNFLESLSQAMLVGVMLVGGLGVYQLYSLPRAVTPQVVVTLHHL